MINTHASSMPKTWSRRAGFVAAGAVAIIVGGFAVQANADGGALTAYDELDSPNPLSVTEGLAFFKGADLGWVLGGAHYVSGTGFVGDTHLSDVDSLAYTVDSAALPYGSTATSAYAPSYQLVLTNDHFTYGRLVWEPYMQAGSLNVEHGAYTDLEDGLWWTSKIAAGAGSQDDPQPLSFFEAGGDAGWSDSVVAAFAVHQGTTTDVTSIVSDASFNGEHAALGNADVTPFNQADIDAAVAAATSPLNDEISGLQGDLFDAQNTVTDLQAQLDAKQDDLSAAQTELAEAQTELAEAQSDLGDALGDYGDALEAIDGYLDDIDGLRDDVDALEEQLEDAEDAATTLAGQLSDAQDALTEEQAAHTTDNATAATQIATLQGQLASSTSALTAYMSTHHFADGTGIGYSRATLSATPVHGDIVGVKLSGSIAKATGVHYQWYVGGTAVSGATHSTYKVPSSAKGKAVNVKVTGTYNYVLFAVYANSLAAK